ncbi:transmembrane protease serine 9-like isoform X2 [Cynoglossus semilaevis]|nr:transmembrane protease serine 9-like isoform X2 [Cynoglossus semilaevis]
MTPCRSIAVFLCLLLSLLIQESRSQLDVCGRPPLNTRIVGGESASPGSWPWQVSLQRFGYHLCGGSLINKEWVLTATSCLSSGTEGLVVYLGRQMKQSSSSHEVNRTIVHIISHPSYNSYNGNNDISLLKLSSPVNFTNYIRPICLADSNSTFYNGTMGWLTGWGNVALGEPLPPPQNLTEVNIPVVGNKECDCAYGKGFIKDTMMCAGSRVDRKGLCHGDIGTPLVFKQHGVWIQAGIAIFSLGCGETDFPSVYIRVSKYMTWISGHITDNGPGFVNYNSSGTDDDADFFCANHIPPPTLAPTPANEICGQAPLNSRIVGGQEAPGGNWPWQVGLFYWPSFLCGATLINQEWVLTAAHCVRHNDTRWLVLFFGMQSLSIMTAKETYRFVEEIVIHPDYVLRTSDNDIALLRFSPPLNYTDYIRPICLADSDSTFNNATEAWATGFGLIGRQELPPPPHALREVEVPILGNRQCNCYYGVGTITDNMMCAGLPAGGKDTCEGDLGGPLMSKQSGRWILAGVASYGSECGKPLFPGVYTRVSRYQSWIDTYTSGDRPGFLTFSSTGKDGDLNHTCDGIPPITNPPPKITPPKTTAGPVVCGQAPMNTRLVGGASVTSAGMWPWMASLQMNGTHVCGGTLVDEDSVLSDANCFSGSNERSGRGASEWTVILGRLKQNGSNPFEMKFNVTNITMSNETGSNVAVLHLQTRPTLSDYIQPICLGTTQIFGVGTTCYVAGWSFGQGGEEQVLQELQTKVVECGDTSTTDNICTEDFTLEKGDAGGPLMCKQRSFWFQAAVLMPETNTTTQTRAGKKTFVSITAFSNFLSSTLGQILSPPTINIGDGVTPGPDQVTTDSGTLTQSSSFLLFFHLLFLSLCLHLSF